MWLRTERKFVHLTTLRSMHRALFSIMKKVLIITYYWPPAGGVGVQRWLQLSKHLQSNGWEPIIFTAKDANYPIIDENLTKQVPKEIETLQLKVPEPNNIISFFQRKNKSKNLYSLQQQSNVDKSFLKKLLWSIRGNFFIPDARMFWIKKSYKYLDKYLQKKSIDAIVSTGPPHSAHMIAKKVSDKHNLPWISDFRDPWTSMDYLKKMNLKKFAIRKHDRLEKSILLNSTYVTVVGKAIEQEFKEKYGIESVIINNGYNNSDDEVDVIPLDSKFTITHTGSFLHNRNCNDLWSSLSQLVKENENFSNDLEIKLIGNIAPAVLESIERYGLMKYLNRINHVDHDTAKAIQRSAQLLLLPIDRIDNAEFVITGKMFEYLKAKRPILLLGPSKGDAADIIRSCSAGFVIDFDNTDLIKQTLVGIYQRYTDKNNECHSIGIEKYSYKELTKKVVELLDKSIKK